MCEKCWNLVEEKATIALKDIGFRENDLRMKILISAIWSEAEEVGILKWDCDDSNNEG